MTPAPYLLADVGGTHARFMRAPRTGPLPAPTVLETADCATFEAALARFLALDPGGGAIEAVAVAAAGPVAGDGIRLTNGPWSVSRQGLRAATGTDRTVLINDFAALAEALPALEPGDVKALGGGVADPAAPALVLGPGTGLGVAAYLPAVAGAPGRVLAGEGGHVDLPVATPREWALIAHLQVDLGHVSAERLVSGPGLARLYRALEALDGVAPTGREGQAIDAAARAGEARAREAIGLFTDWLGAVAGNAALTLGARGGVYLAGGILPQWGDLLDGTRLRRRFEAKGRFSSYLARVPLGLIVSPLAAFRGLRRLAEGT